jgi:hypothetical protein
MSKILQDHLIVNAIKSGDSKVFGKFYDQYASAFYGDIKRTLLKEDISEQTLRQVFIDICSNIDKYNPDNERFFTWSLKVARKEIRRRKTDMVICELFGCQRPPDQNIVQTKTESNSDYF